MELPPLAGEDVIAEQTAAVHSSEEEQFANNLVVGHTPIHLQSPSFHLVWHVIMKFIAGACVGTPLLGRSTP